MGVVSRKYTVSNLHSNPAPILTSARTCSKQRERSTLSRTVRGPAWAVGAVEDECGAEHGSGCLFVTRPRTAHRCAFVVGHLVTNKVENHSSDKKQQQHTLHRESGSLLSLSQTKNRVLLPVQILFYEAP